MGYQTYYEALDEAQAEAEAVFTNDKTHHGMNYGQAIEAMKRGGSAKRNVAGAIRIAHRGTPLQYLAYEYGMPFNPSVADQLAEDWQVEA